MSYAYLETVTITPEVGDPYDEVKIARIGAMPYSARRLDTGDWVLGLRDADPSLQQATGWYEVVDTPRPDDTPTTTHDRSVELVAGIPTVTWTERPFTAEELDAINNPPTGVDDILAAVEALLLES